MDTETLIPFLVYWPYMALSYVWNYSFAAFGGIVNARRHSSHGVLIGSGYLSGTRYCCDWPY